LLGSDREPAARPPGGDEQVAAEAGFDGRRATFPVLPAADQCGYRAYLPSFGVAEPELQLGGR